MGFKSAGRKIKKIYHEKMIIFLTFDVKTGLQLDNVIFGIYNNRAAHKEVITWLILKRLIPNCLI